MAGERIHKKRRAEPEDDEGPAEEEAFPRGGGDKLLTPLEKRQLAAKANEDFQAEQKAGKKPKKGKDAEDDFFKASGDITGKGQRYVELLKYKTLSVGMKLWGMVLECTAKGLVISLPQGLRGHVAPEEASDALRQMLDPESKPGAAMRRAFPGSRAPALPDLFSIGQYVRTTVIALGADSGDDAAAARGRGRVVLSLRLKRLLEGAGAGEALAVGRCVPAVVRTVEDHVYTLGFGVKGVSGVLPRKDFASYYGGDASLVPGQLLDVVVTKAMAAQQPQVLQVTVSHDAVASATVKDAGGGLTLASLQPGMLVSAKVRQVLQDGLVVSFLTYFNGTIDQFHLSEPIPSANWRDRYQEGQKLKARIVYVDIAAKKAGLSLLPHLINYRMPAAVPMLGQVFDDATIRRIDPALGLLLELPSSPLPAPAFAHVSNLADGRVDKPEKAFKVGQVVKARVIGFRLVDGLALVSLKPSVLEQQVYSMKDLYPGQPLEATVLSSDPDRGLVVQITPAIKALVPALHASDLGTKRSKGKHKEGAKVQGRVLSVDPDAKKVTLTLKKALLGSKLAPLADARQAAVGMKAHGVVTGIKDGYGLFVTFYNGVAGVIKKSQLGLLPGQKIPEAYEIGQVLRVQITAVNPATRQIQLTLAKKGVTGDAAGDAMGDAAGDAAGDKKKERGLPGGFVVGDVVTAGCVVKAVEEKDGAKAVVVLEIEGKDGGARVTARLPCAHLSDHPTAADKLSDQIRPGITLPGPFIILSSAAAAESGGKKGGKKGSGKKGLLVSRKASLVTAAASLPAAVGDVAAGAKIPGYVAHVTGDAVFVRFLDGVTGRAGLPQLADTFVTDPSRHFAPGQSVRAAVAEVDAERWRFSVTLKPSAVGAGDGEYLDSMFRDLEVAAQLQAEAEKDDPEGGALEWGDIAPGALVTGRVAPDGIKPFGLTVDLDAAPDAVGVVTPDLGAKGAFAPGAVLEAAVADVAKGDGIVDLCLIESVVAGAGGGGSSGEGAAVIKAPKRKLKVGQDVTATLLTLKPHYAIASLPTASHALAFLPLCGPNTQPPGGAPPPAAARGWVLGSEVAARITALPSAANGGRLVLSAAAAAAAGAGAKQGDGKGGKAVAEEREAVVTGTVVSVGPLGMEVKYGKSGSAHLHIGEVLERLTAPPTDSPLSPFKPGASLTAAYLGHIRGLAGRRGKGVELSLRPSALAAAKKGEKVQPAVSPVELSPGDKVIGWVSEIGPDHFWLSLGPAAKGRVHMFDACDAPRQCAGFKKRFSVGQALTAAVVSVDARRQKLDLTLRDDVVMRPHAAGAPALPAPGQLLIGKIQSVKGSGVIISLGWHALGIVALSDIHDAWADNALAGLTDGAFVRARVLDGPPDARGRLRLSLRPSDGGIVEAMAPPAPAGGGRAGAAPAGLLKADKLVEGAEVQGYVRHVSAKGLFVTLDRDHDARVKLSNMSDGFLEDPAAAFPEGSLVRGRLISVSATGADGGVRLEMSLRSGGGGGAWRQIEDVQEGELTTGKVRRVEKYGVFIDLARSNVCGLAHISQCGDGHIKDLNQRYQRGQVVRVRVLSVDPTKRQVSLSMKPELVAEEEEEEDEGAAAAAAAGMNDGKAAAGGKRKDMDDLMVDAAEEEEEEEEEGSGGSEDERAAAGGFDLDEMDVDEDGGSGSDLDSDLEGSGSGSEEEDEEEGDGFSSGSEEEEEEEGSSDDEEQGAVRKAVGLAGAAVGGWGELALDVDAAESGEEEPAAAAKLSKAQKRRAKADREAAIAAAEAARAAGGGASPTSEAEFERLLVGSPDSSYLWIRYMAFLISLGETDRARAVAERALAAINFREEGEKFNVWVAWLNLENAYGTPDPAAALMALFNRALQYTDQKKLYLALLGILQRGAREQLLEDTVKAMTKKFSGSCKVWLRAIEHALTTGGDAAGDASRRLLERALAALPRRKHVKAISHAALLEFRVGSPERGRSMMEGVLQNYPKRLDLWGMYIDQEVKQADADRVRNLLERATSLTLPPKKMKFLFRRWLEFEKGHGSAEQVQHVKQRALEYVQAHQE